MALITGSTKTDWSTVPLQPIDVHQQISEFATRLDQAITEFNNKTVTVRSDTSTLLSFTLSNGATATVRGSGFFSNDAVVKSFEYSDPATHEIVRFTGTIAVHTENDISTVNSITVNSLTVQTSGFQATIIGNKITVVQDGVKTHDNVEVASGTGGELDNQYDQPGPIFLQGDHGTVWFRNIQIKELK